VEARAGVGPLGLPVAEDGELVEEARALGAEVADRCVGIQGVAAADEAEGALVVADEHVRVGAAGVEVEVAGFRMRVVGVDFQVQRRVQLHLGRARHAVAVHIQVAAAGSGEVIVVVVRSDEAVRGVEVTSEAGSSRERDGGRRGGGEQELGHMDAYS
jgi:hypothetical protein